MTVPTGLAPRENPHGSPRRGVEVKLVVKLLAWTAVLLGLWPVHVDAGSRPGPQHAGRWGLEAHLGGAWSVPLRLTIRQDGHEDLSLTARWKAKALEPPLYYVYRVATWREGRGWALDLTHHKLHLANRPSEVEDFAVSHGYNLLTLHQLIERGNWRYGPGIGIVIAHPESEVRGRRFDEHRGMFREGYYVSGPTTSLLGGYTREVAGSLYVTWEVRLTGSYARVPIAGGRADVPNLALHGTVGLGWGTR